MRTYLYGFVASVFTIFATCIYVYFNAQQLMHLIETQPSCFPPYVLMNQHVRHASEEAYRIPAGCDDGLTRHSWFTKRKAFLDQSETEQ